MASAVNAEPSVPARMQIDWNASGTTNAFETLTTSAIKINLANPNMTAAVIRIGSESIDVKTLAVNPQIVSAPTPAPVAGLPATFLPSFSIGNLSGTDIVTVTEFNTFAGFAAQLPKSIVAATPAYHFVATGVFNRSTSTFTASSIDVVN